LAILALNPERQDGQKLKTKNGRLASLASNSNTLVVVLILELWTKMGLTRPNVRDRGPGSDQLDSRS